MLNPSWALLQGRLRLILPVLVGPHGSSWARSVLFVVSAAHVPQLLFELSFQANSYKLPMVSPLASDPELLVSYYTRVAACVTPLAL